MDYILNHYYEIASMILFGIGLMGLLLHNNLVKKAIGLNIMDTAVYLLYLEELLQFLETTSHRMQLSILTLYRQALYLPES